MENMSKANGKILIFWMKLRKKQNKRAMRVGLFQLLKQLISQPPKRKTAQKTTRRKIYIFTLQWVITFIRDFSFQKQKNGKNSPFLL